MTALYESARDRSAQGPGFSLGGPEPEWQTQSNDYQFNIASTLYQPAIVILIRDYIIRSWQDFGRIVKLEQEDGNKRERIWQDLAKIQQKCEGTYMMLKTLLVVAQSGF